LHYEIFIKHTAENGLQKASQQGGESAAAKIVSQYRLG
jgi:hypothetical protein